MNEKYEELSPYKVAKKANVLVDYCDLGDRVAGVYADLGTYQVVLNKRMDNDRRDDCLQLLLEHHFKHPGVEKRILKHELGGKAQIVKKIVELNRIIPRLMMMKRLREET